MFTAIKSLLRACFCGANDAEQHDSPVRPVDVSISLKPLDGRGPQG
jgi:hypothetical protein